MQAFTTQDMLNIISQAEQHLTISVLRSHKFNTIGQTRYHKAILITQSNHDNIKQVITTKHS